MMFSSAVQAQMLQAERRRAAEAAAETEAAARAEAMKLVLEKQLQQEAGLQQVHRCWVQHHKQLELITLGSCRV